MNSNELYKKTLSMRIAALLLALIALIISLPAYAWFAKLHKLAAYAPVSSPEALFIGAGHTDFENNQFEDVRYIYFTGLDATEETRYDYRVFCIYGKAVPGYKLQLAYTTNNRFTYDLFHAYESDTEQPGSVVSYKTHTARGGETPPTYYYSFGYVSALNPLEVVEPTEENPASPIDGIYLNSDDGLLATNALHSETYAVYDGGGEATGSYDNVNMFAESVYWQTSDVIVGNAKGSFVHYYIIRVNKGAKTSNDRETDLLCIAAKIFSISSGSPEEGGE